MWIAIITSNEEAHVGIKKEIAGIRRIDKVKGWICKEKLVNV